MRHYLKRIVVSNFLVSWETYYLLCKTVMCILMYYTYVCWFSAFVAALLLVFVHLYQAWNPPSQRYFGQTTGVFLCITANVSIVPHCPDHFLPETGWSAGIVFDTCWCAPGHLKMTWTTNIWVDVPPACYHCSSIVYSFTCRMDM